MNKPKKIVIIKITLLNIFYSLLLNEFKLKYLLELFLLMFFYNLMYVVDITKYVKED